MLTCKECSYCWKAENETYPRCHFERIFSFDLAPCEQEEEEMEEEKEWSESF